MNPILVKAGILYLLDKDKEKFIDSLVLYMEKHENALEFLVEGPLPINDSIEKAIKDFIETKHVPCPKYLKGIKNIEVTFDYCDRQQYNVTAEVIRWSDESGNIQETKDEKHQLPYYADVYITINPIDINSNKWQKS